VLGERAGLARNEGRKVARLRQLHETVNGCCVAAMLTARWPSTVPAMSPSMCLKRGMDNVDEFNSLLLEIRTGTILTG